MYTLIHKKLAQIIILTMLMPLLSGCSVSYLRPINQFNSLIRKSSPIQLSPSLSGGSLAYVSKINDTDRLKLLDLKKRRLIEPSLMTLSSFRIISLGISGDGKTVAFIREREGSNEMLLYEIVSRKLRRLQLPYEGNPVKVSLDGFGKIAAVQLQRGSKDSDSIVQLITIKD